VFAPRVGSYLLAGLLPPFLFVALGLLHVLAEAPALLAAVAFLVLWGLLAVFFRDPTRPVGSGIVSPADGRVQFVQPEGDRVRVAVFMNVTDVHVNRIPIDAEVVAVGNGGHGFAPAYSDRAKGNVQREYRLRTSLGEVTVVQITGILARRLVSFIGAGDRVAKGDRLGMIALGSRVDLLLPLDRVEVRVRPGDRVRAGVTTVATERP
jgi:phosphatidylserine decarboxylase